MTKCDAVPDPRNRSWSIATTQGRVHVDAHDVIEFGGLAIGSGSRIGVGESRRMESFEAEPAGIATARRSQRTLWPPHQALITAASSGGPFNRAESLRVGSLPTASAFRMPARLNHLRQTP